MNGHLPFFQFQTTYPLPHAMFFSKPYSSWGVTNGAFEEWRVRKYYETNPLALLVLLGNRMLFVIDRILNNGILSFTLYDASSDFPLTPHCSTGKTPPDPTQKYRH